MDSSWMAIIGILAIGGIFAYLYFGGISVPGFSLGGADLSYFYHHVIEIEGDEFVDSLEDGCDDAGGDWIDTPSKFGCYNIPSGEFDIVNCNSLMATIFQTYCEGLKANWECNINSVGCRY